MSSAIQIFKKTVRASSGTQSNELAAKIKSVTSSTTIGAVFLYDTRSDSDGGAWRKKTSHTSWAREAASATRSSRSQFPSVALIVADNVSATSTLSIYDLDDVSAPLWMQFTQGGSFPDQYILGRSTPNITSVTALNGRVYVGMDNSGYGEALVEIDFANDGAKMFSTTSWKQNNSIAERNTAVTNTQAVGGDIVNNAVNDVAATYLEGGELDSLGLVRPVVACATGGGVSVIHPNGSVYNIQSTNASYRVNGKIQIDGKFVYFPLDSTSTNARTLQVHPIPYAAVNPTLSEDLVADKYATASTSGTAAMPRYLGNNTLQLAKFNGGFAVGTTTGLSVFKDNEGNRADGMVSYHTSTYCTGYMLGDIRFAGLANANAADRSVKGNALTVNNTSGSDYVEEAAVATNAELKAYSNFKAGNYLSRASDTDFDFGTGDFSIMGWVKFSSDASSGPMTIFDRAYYNSGSYSGAAITLRADVSNDEKFKLEITDDGYSTSDAVSSTSTPEADSNWHQFVALRRGSNIEMFVDGRYEARTAISAASGSLSNSNATLTIGLRAALNQPLGNGSLSLVRISATAPTPQQVKEIYEAEKPLFRAGAKCLLYANTVKDLAYDNSTGLLSVGQNATSGNDGVVNFRGLEKVSSFQADDYSDWSGNTSHKLAAAGGVSAYARTSGTGGVLVDLPAIDVRGDINTADTKLPDDGKLHFSGVTTDATVTTIGQIPVAANEVSNVKVRVNGCKYNASDSSYRLNGEINQSFSRNMSGNVVEESEGMKLVESDAASTDIDLVADTSAQTIEIKVTGISATRMVWKAEVEVQRISEKTYER